MFKNDCSKLVCVAEWNAGAVCGLQFHSDPY